MALPILDGNQSATTLSSILTSGEHIPAHTVVSLGTQAITNIATAVSGSVVSVSNFPATQPVSIASVTIGSLPLIAGTVTANPTGTQTIAGTVTLGAGTAQIGSVTASNLVAALGEYEINAQEKTFAVVASINGQGYVSDSAKSHITNSVTIGSLPLIAGTVTANNTNLNRLVQDGEADGTFGVPLAYAQVAGGQLDYFKEVNQVLGLPIRNDANPLVVSGTVTLGAGTAQIGSVTASISNFPATQAISIASVTIGNSVTIGSLPLIAGTVTATISPEDIKGGLDLYTFDSQEPWPVQVVSGSFGGLPLPISGTVTASISNFPATQPVSIASVTIGSLPLISGTVTANTFALQGTAVTTSDFTSTTASTLLAGFNATREVLTIFNEGAGNLHICAGATCTTIAYQVRLSAGDYYEVPNSQTSITHSAVFATGGGTARVTEVS